MGMFKKFYHLILLLLLFVFGFIFVPKTQALLDADNLNKVIKIIDAPKEFCEKRSGNLMNLETWYSGKCSAETFTLSGDGVGFSDIIFLQGIEYLIGPQQSGFIEKITALISDSGTQPINIAHTKDNGLIGSLNGTLKTLLTVKPATTPEFIAYLSRNLHRQKITSSVYAADAGYGFTALSPMIKIWQAFRNISYVFFALAFVVYGVMIMLRIKIDSKTVASIQLAIPKLVTTLLLITFSYAIVGLIVDLSTVASALLINILKLGGILTDPTNLKVQAAAGTYSSLISFLANWTTSLIATPWIIFNTLIGAGGNIIVTAVGGAVVTYFFGWIIYIVLFIAIAFSYFKLILKLFESFISIVVSLIFSPIILLGNILPGSNAFSGWLMGIIANASVFPVSSFLLVLSYALMVQPIFDIASLLKLGNLASDFYGVQNLTTTGGTIWTPPLTLPSDSSASLMLGAIGVGLLLMASKYVDIVKDALKVPPFKYGSAIGEALKTGFKNREPLRQRLSTTFGRSVDEQGARADRLESILKGLGLMS